MTTIRLTGRNSIQWREAVGWRLTRNGELRREAGAAPIDQACRSASEMPTRLEVTNARLAIQNPQVSTWLCSDALPFPSVSLDDVEFDLCKPMDHPLLRLAIRLLPEVRG